MTAASWPAAALRFLLIGVCALVASACSSSASQPQSSIADQMHLADQLTCNSNGKFYDNIKATCTNVPVATWPCTLAGYKQRDANATSATQAQRTAVVQGMLTQGLTMAQCGEVVAGTIAYVMFQRAANSKTSSSVQAKLLLLALTPASTATAGSGVGTAGSGGATANAN